MGKGKTRSVIAIAVTFFLAGGGSPGLFAAQQPATWLGGTGNWTDATKWSTGVVPNNNATDTFDVNIDNGNLAAASVVTIGGSGGPSFTVDAVTIDAGDTLRFDWATLNTAALTVNGTLAMGYTATVNVGGTGAVAGTGTVSFANYYNANLSAAGSTLTIEPGITIRGGQGSQSDLYPAFSPINIGSSADLLVNKGRIVSDVPGQLLTIGGSAIDNQGVLEVTAGASLGIRANFSLAGIGTLINNGGSVVIMQTLENSGQTLPVNTAKQWTLTGTLNGGTAAGAGWMYVPYSAAATLWNVTLNTTLKINGDVGGVLAGGNGTIEINNPEAIEGSGNVYFDTIPGGITVRGGLSEQFDGDISPGGFPGERARVHVTTNNGRIRAQKSIFNDQGRLRLMPGSGTTITNNGTVEVSDGGTLISLANLTFGANSDLVVDGGGLLEVQGNLNLSSLSDFLEVLPRADGAAYNSQLIATYTGTLTGTFNGRTPGIVIQYATALKQIRITGTPVPEPSSVGFIVGLVGGLACRRRRLRG